MYNDIWNMSDKWYDRWNDKLSESYFMILKRDKKDIIYRVYKIQKTML